VSMHYTEMTFASRVVEWINEIIEREKLPFDRADIEIMDPTKKRPDVILWEKRIVKKALILEVKRPDADPWGEVLDDALSKAWRNNIPYFATWNVSRFFSWETFASGDVIDKLWYPHATASEVVAPVKSLGEIDRFEDAVKKFLKDFLKEFADIYYQVKAKPPLAIDERFIYRLRAAMDALSIPVFDFLKSKYKSDEPFKGGLKKWFLEQGWTFAASDEDFEKIARQYVLLLIDKIMFYNVLRIRRKLPKIEMPLGVGGEQFKDVLQSYFKECLREDYETVFSTNFLDSLAPPDDAVGQLKDFVHKISEHDFSKIGYELLGRIFERLIPDQERHKLGQYFTRPDVVDLIIGFCVTQADDKVLDGGCGAGTFLVRSYMRKKSLEPRKVHKELLQELYGIDIAKFPAHLTTINLAIRDLSETENYPRVLYDDFFDVRPGKESTLIPQEYLTEGLRLEKIKVKVPHFDSVVMNPPYTRQEEMEDILAEEKEKAHIICIRDWMKLSSARYTEKEQPTLSKRSSIYVHFFIHGASFLNKGGRLGLITSNSWLDVDYGCDLQRFFLENFKIVAIIESKVERWFIDADINTSITILERCDDKKEKMNNLVKFVQLKKPLSHFVPPTDEEEERWETTGALIDNVNDAEAYCENDDLRIFPRKQEELWNEGYDEDANEYVGSKWGKYIRAPEIFYKALNKGVSLFVPLRQVAKPTRGLRTGDNSFFYIDKDAIKSLGLEKKFLRPVVKSPREVPGIIVKEGHLKFCVLDIGKPKNKIKGSNVLKYINLGERRGVNEKNLVKVDGLWYNLGVSNQQHPILVPEVIDIRHVVFLNETDAVADQRFSVIIPKKGIDPVALCSLLNSSFNALTLEIIGRTALGLGGLDLPPSDLRLLPTIDPQKLSKTAFTKLKKAFEQMSERNIYSIFKEVGASNPQEVQLEKVAPERLALDNVIFDMLAMNQREREDVYRALVEMVKSRIERAESVKRQARKQGGVDVGSLVNSILEEVGGKLRKFPDDYIGSCECRLIEVPKGLAEAGSDLQGFYIRVGGKEVRCKSSNEARYIEYAVLNGHTTIRIPEDEKLIKKSVEEYSKLLKDAKKLVSEFVDSSIPDKKLRKKVKAEVWRRLGS